MIRRHHPFEGQCLEVLRHLKKRNRLLFVVLLPDGSKSHIPAEWTDFAAGPSTAAKNTAIVGAPEHLLALRFLTDALLQRTASAAVTPQSSPEQESHAATESELHRHSYSTGVFVGGPPQRTKAPHHRDLRATDVEGRDSFAFAQSGGTNKGGGQ
ncbi:MAG: hypothetical protein HYX68_00025 [Planctomycetes bacterium]|nr:hypothetical protein [Planctomycetota bacterium]